MSRETLFGYLAAFVTVVLAMALTDLLQSLHRLLRRRTQVRWDVLPLLAAGFTYLMVLSEFFSLWQSMQVGTVTFPGLVGTLITPSLIAMAAFISLPDEVPPDGVDLRAFYAANRPYLGLVLVLANLSDLARTLIRIGPHVLLDPWQLGFFGITYLPFFAGCLLLARSERRALQFLAYALLYATSLTGFVGWTIRAA